MLRTDGQDDRVPETLTESVAGHVCMIAYTNYVTDARVRRNQHDLGITNSF